MNTIIQFAKTWTASLLVAGVTVVAALLIHLILFAALKRVAKSEGHPGLRSFVRNFRRVALAAILLFGLQLSFPLLRIEPPWSEYLSRCLHVAWIMVLFWSAHQGLLMLEEFLLDRFQMDVTDNLRARKVRTQIQVLKKVVYVVLGIIAAAVILMSFQGGQKVGTSLLASAGVAGLVLGMAAQRTLGNVLAGIQIAITQPIRLDDVVIVEGEWGKIEDITLTYVVVCIWDYRRLILPISYFIEKPFQNWTRVSADILTTVVLPLDYSVPVDELRSEYQRILESAEDWDGEVSRIQVVDATDRTMQVRMLMSAADSGAAWMLKCHVREKMIEYIRANYPGSLPRLRAEVSSFDGSLDMQPQDKSEPRRE